jgi:hypothetical protein
MQAELNKTADLATTKLNAYKKLLKDIAALYKPTEAVKEEL